MHFSPFFYTQTLKIFLLLPGQIQTLIAPNNSQGLSFPKDFMIVLLSLAKPWPQT